MLLQLCAGGAEQRIRQESEAPAIFVVLFALHPLPVLNRHLLDLREQAYSIEIAMMRVIGGCSMSAIALRSSAPSPSVSHLCPSGDSDRVALCVGHKVEGRMCQ